MEAQTLTSTPTTTMNDDQRIVRLNIDGAEYDCSRIMQPEPEKPDPRLEWEGEKDSCGDLVSLKCYADYAAVRIMGMGVACTPPMLYALALAAVRAAMALEGVPESKDYLVSPCRNYANKSGAAFNLRKIVEASK